jgi:hypothetical protein
LGVDSFENFTPFLTFPQGGRNKKQSIPLCGTGKGVNKYKILTDGEAFIKKAARPLLE